MSNKPLHIRCRPKKLSDIIGNDSLKTRLEALLKRKNIPKVYLLSGNYGCGKTTFARIFGRELGCDKHTIIEIDAAKDRGVDTSREIIDMIKHPTISGKPRLIIIDEAHSLTSAFQQSMLKTLEDTPDNVYFILCTTEPQKIIKTIKSRCVKLTVKTLTDNEMQKFLKSIIDKERLQIKSNILQKIIDASEGVPRDALLFMEQCIGLKEKEITEDIFIKDEIQHQVIDLCRAIMWDKNWSKARKIIASILESHASNLETVRMAILGYASAVAIKNDQINTRAMLVYECFSKPFYGGSAKADFVFACLFTIKN